MSKSLAFPIACLMLVCGPAWANDLVGEWVLSIDTPRGVQNPTLVVEANGEGYSGVYNSMRGPIPIDSISFDGQSFAFPLVITVPIGEIEVNYRGSIDGDAMRGSVQNPRGEVAFTGSRQ